MSIIRKIKSKSEIFLDEQVSRVLESTFRVSYKFVTPNNLQTAIRDEGKMKGNTVLYDFKGAVD